jgi:NAD(P)-dependent dehydrogenase (short-subunit alcohol dehydrogenase family)
VDELAGKTAVVTGAASGIGRALAERFAREGMNMVIADIEAEALAKTERGIQEAGAAVLSSITDVSHAEQVEALAGSAFERFGAVHVLCSNAGVMPPVGACWERSLEDWSWVLGVNLWGVIHGMRSFVPRMIESGAEGHIVNTASGAGLFSRPYGAIYNVSKHGVVTLSETLHQELSLSGSRLSVSVLCPSWVNTRIADSDRNRPESAALLPETAQEKALREMVKAQLSSGLNPGDVAEQVFAAVRERRFYILPHQGVKDRVKARMEDILNERAPTPDMTP